MIAGGSVYGVDSAIRRWAEGHRRGYVLAVTTGQRMRQRRVTTWIGPHACTLRQSTNVPLGDLGFVHIDITHLPKPQTGDGERRKRCLFVAINRCSRAVHLPVKNY